MAAGYGKGGMGGEETEEEGVSLWVDGDGMYVYVDIHIPSVHNPTTCMYIYTHILHHHQTQEQQPPQQQDDDFEPSGGEFALSEAPSYARWRAAVARRRARARALVRNGDVDI